MDNHTEITDQAKQLISIKEAAMILGICSRTMYRLIDSGKAPRPVRLGRAVRLVRTEVAEYIDRLKAARPRFLGILLE